MLKFKLIKS